MTHSRTYDTDYRLTGRIDSGVLDYAYTLDATGNITEHTNVTEIGFCDEQFCGSAVTLDINRYQYDTVHRLTQSDMNSDIEAFSYDALGNRLSRTHNGASRQYFYGLEDHRLRQIANGTVHSFTHDALGNTLSTYSHTFSYDDNNRIKTVDDTASTLLATYTYNVQNLRTKKVAATSTYYHYNHEGQLISESDNSGNITREYMYLNGSPIAMSDADGLYYLHSDHLGTPKVMTDSQQGIVWQATHTAFGEARTDEDPDGDGVNVRLNIRFPGQYYDQETNLHYNLQRYYDPTVGRYITSDRIGLAGGVNTYGYALQNPINYYDPNGEEAASAVARTFGSVGSLGVAGTALANIAGVAGAGYLGYEAGNLLNPYIQDGLAGVIDSICLEDEQGCQEEWEWAYRECEKLINDPIEKENWRKVGKRPPSLHSCAKGYVSERCGGNIVEYQK